METYTLKRKLSQRGRYGLGIVLDSRFCQRHGLKVGDTVEMFDHPTKKDVLCIRITMLVKKIRKARNRG
jgi:hypothetical protein